MSSSYSVLYSSNIHQSNAFIRSSVFSLPINRPFHCFTGVPVDVPGTEEAHEDNPVDSEYNENTFQQYKAEVQQTVGKLPFQKSFEEYKDEDVKFYLYTR